MVSYGQAGGGAWRCRPTLEGKCWRHGSMRLGGLAPLSEARGGIDGGVLFLFCDQPMIFYGQIWGPGGAYLLTAWGRIGGGPKIFSQGKVQKKKKKTGFGAFCETSLQKHCF